MSEEEYCRWYEDGFCTLCGEQCGGYDPNDCGLAEDFDDCNPDYE